MQKAPSRKQIDEMIETCIRATNEGRLLTQKEGDRFVRLLIGASQSGASLRNPWDVWGKSRKATVAGTVYPQSILIDALEAGLIEKPGHKKFIAQHKAIIRIETSLLILRHTQPTRFKGISNLTTGKPINERWEILRSLSGLDFDGVEGLGERFARARNKAAFERDKEKKQRLLRQAKRISKKLKKEADALALGVRQRLAAKFAKPDAKTSLARALKNKRGELTGKDLEKLMRAHEMLAARKKPGVKRYGKR